MAIQNNRNGAAVAKSAATGKQPMLPVSRKAAVSSPKVNTVSAGKSAGSGNGIVLGTTKHKAGADGFSHHPAC